MRKKDDQKIEAIKQAVLDITLAEGIVNLSTAKVAKAAKVSPATLYIYYQDKTDLLSKLYVEFKLKIHEGFAEAVQAANGNLEEEIRILIKYSVSRMQQYPKEANFIGALWDNQSLLNEETIAFGQTFDETLLRILTSIQQHDDYTSAPPEIIAEFLSLPIQILRRTPDLSGEKLDQVVDMLVKAIKA